MHEQGNVYQTTTVYIYFTTSPYRNPTPDDDMVKWSPAKEYPVDYLRIGKKDVEDRPWIQMETDLLPERAAFWKSLGAHLPPKKSENKA